MEIKIKWIPRKQMTHENTYRDDKYSKCHAESVRFLEIDLGHVTHFSSLGAIESQTLCDRIRSVNSIRAQGLVTIFIFFPEYSKNHKGGI